MPCSSVKEVKKKLKIIEREDTRNVSRIFLLRPRKFKEGLEGGL
jgi:hypothetical protein